MTKFGDIGKALSDVWEQRESEHNKEVCSLQKRIKELKESRCCPFSRNNDCAVLRHQGNLAEIAKENIDRSLEMQREIWRLQAELDEVRKTNATK